MIEAEDERLWAAAAEAGRLPAGRAPRPRRGHSEPPRPATLSWQLIRQEARDGLVDE